MENDREAAAAGTTEQEKAENRTAEAREDSIRREYSFAPDVELKECRFCRVMIPKKAKVCPNCRMNLKRHWFRNLAAAVFAIAVIGVGGYYLSGHWGIMQDAVMSVWMAQKGTAVPVVSVTTVDTEEMASGATAAEPSEVALAGESDEKTVQEAPGEAGEQAAEAEEPAELPETDPEAKAQLQEAEPGKTAEHPEAEPKGTAKQQEAESEKLVESQTGDPEESEALQETAKTEEVQKAASSAEAEEVQKAASSVETEAVQKAADSAESEGVQKAADPEKTEEMQKTADSKETDELQEGTELTGSRKAAQVQELSEENRTGDDTEAAGETAENEDQKENVLAEDRDQEEQTFREKCIGVSYKALLRDMDTYLDTALKVEAEVICQVSGGLFDENIYYFCMHEEKNGIKRYYIIRDDREEDGTLILEGDMLTVYGKLFASCKLPASLIETRPTVPAVSMLYFDLIEE